MKCEKEIRKTIHFTIASLRIKYLEINLTEEVKDLYTENYKTLMKQMERYPCSWVERLHIVKISHYRKRFTDSM